MSFSQMMGTVFEIALVVFALWSVFHEDIFIAFEERIAASFRRRRNINVIKGASSRTFR